MRLTKLSIALATSMVALSGLCSSSDAGIILLGTSPSVAPSRTTASDFGKVLKSDQTTIYVWAAATDFAYTKAISANVFAAASGTTGFPTATGSQPAGAVASGYTWAFPASSYGNSASESTPTYDVITSVSANNYATAPYSAVGKANLVSNISVNNASMSTSQAALIAQQLVLIGSFKITAANAGKVDLYLGAGTNAISEYDSSLVSQVAGGINSQFGAGANPFLGTTVAGGNRLRIGDHVAATIEFVNTLGPSFTYSATATGATPVPGTGVSYVATLDNSGIYALQGTPSAASQTLVAIDLSGTLSDTDKTALLGSLAAVGATDVSAQPYGKAFFNNASSFAQTTGSYDFVFAFAAGTKFSGTVGITGLTGGVTVNSIAVVPEPTSLAAIGLIGLPLLTRRTRRA